jgi:hypothetical protein
MLESVAAIALLAWSVAVWHGWTRSRFSRREATRGVGASRHRWGQTLYWRQLVLLRLQDFSWNNWVRSEAVEWKTCPLVERFYSRLSPQGEITIGVGCPPP